jgi:hypothetical protein
MACTVGPPKGSAQKGFVFLTREGCVNTAVMRERLDEALHALGRASDYMLIDQESLGRDDVRAGYPTPTVLVGGKDLFGMPQPEEGARAAT